MRVLWLFLLVTYTCSAIQCHQRLNSPASGKKAPTKTVLKSIASEGTLVVPFKMKGPRKLVIGEPPQGRPLGGNCRLYVELRDTYTQVHTLADLKGLVLIRTPQEALWYVRLLTSPTTVFCWDDIMALEVLSAGNADKHWTFGIKPPVLAFAEPIADAEKVLTDRGLASAQCKKDGRAFVVERWLLCGLLPPLENLGSSTCVKAREVIQRDGGYSRTILKRDISPPKTKWEIWPTL